MPGVLEIKGSYPISPVMYLRHESIQGYIVNHRSLTVEILFVSGFPSKIVDCTNEHLPTVINTLNEFISQKNQRSSLLTNMVSMQDTLNTTMNDINALITLIKDKNIQERLNNVENNLMDLTNDTSILKSSFENLYAMMPEEQKSHEVEADEELEVDEEEVEEAEENALTPEEVEAQEDNNTLNDDSRDSVVLIILMLISVAYCFMHTNINYVPMQQ